MSRKIDWSKAPEGATHYVPETNIYFEAWYKKEDGMWMYWRVDGDHGWCYAGGLPSNAIARPAEWNGTGLPPVGTECEHQGGTGDDEAWYPVLILAHTKVGNRNVAVFQRTDDEIHIRFSDAVFFRPAQSAEEIAAEEREREINELVEAIVTHYEYPKGAESYIGLARALHNAGYRKTEQEHG